MHVHAISISRSFAVRECQRFIGGCLFIREEFTVRECQDFWLPLKSAFSWKDQLYENGRLFIFDLERKKDQIVVSSLY